MKIIYVYANQVIITLVLPHVHLAQINPYGMVQPVPASADTISLVIVAFHVSQIHSGMDKNVSVNQVST